jgi:3-hydroxyisobutyrate dehydrogenase-like beta-hydroxyacid dehydrogenase
MALKTVAILSPGDMGHNVGRALGEADLKVITCLQGRSTRTRALAQAAGIRDVSTLEEMVTQADIVMSILVPGEALKVGCLVAKALKATGSTPYFAECNAISPQTTREIGRVITEGGGRYIDCGIVGSPPGKSKPPRFYVSGAHSLVMLEINGKGIDVRPLGDEIGRASGIKMCYASMTKGTSALYTAVLLTAQALGLSEELKAEFASSQPQVLQHMEHDIPPLPSKAHRWIGEMEEIAATYERAGVTPHFHQGAAEIYRLISRSPFGSERAETIDTKRTLAHTIESLADMPTAKTSGGS